MDERSPTPMVHRLEITGPLDRREMEVFQLEIVRQIRARGVDVKRVMLSEVVDE